MDSIRITAEEKTVRAAELKKLPVGTNVKLHRTVNGEHEYEEGKIVKSGKYTVLVFRDFMNGVYTKPITDLPGQWFTVEGAEGKPC